MKNEFEARRRAHDPLSALPFDLGSQLAAALRDACSLEIPDIFVDLAAWAQNVLLFRGFPAAATAQAIDTIRTNLSAYVPAADARTAARILEKAHRRLSTAHWRDDPGINADSPHGQSARRFLEAALHGDEARAMKEALLCVAAGARIIDIYETLLTPALREAGRLWERGTITIAQEHMVTASTERVMAQLLDLEAPHPHNELSVAVLAPGSAQHHVGARMVADAFALSGWHSSFLGGNLPIEAILEYVDNASVDVLALSGTVAADVAPIRTLIAQLDTRPLSPVVIVGGRAFSLHPSLWRQVGADGYAATPLMAVALASELVCHCEPK